MRTSSLFLACVAPLVALSTGCAATNQCTEAAIAPVPVYVPHHHESAAAAAAGLVVGGVVLASAISDAAGNGIPGNPENEWMTDDGSAPAPDAPPVASGPYGWDPIPPAPQAEEKGPPFDMGGAYAALSNVDLAVCRPAGLRGGYGRVAMTFGKDGAPAGFRVQMPEGSDPAAHACVESAFSQVRVAPFSGAPATVRRSFFVRG